MKIYISAVNFVRGGDKNGRAWKLFHVVDPKGVKYSTFNEEYTGMIGQEIEREVKEEVVEKNGKKYTNKTILEDKKGGGAVWMKLFEKLERIEGKLDRVLGQTGALGNKPPQTLDATGEINPSDIPF